MFMDFFCRKVLSLNAKQKIIIQSVLIVFIVSLSSTPCLADGNSSGHIGFFFIGDTDSQENIEILDDFNYYYNIIVPWLNKNNFTHSYNTKTPFTIASGKNSLTITKDILERDLGMVFLKPDGSYKVSYGVGTGVDIILEINEFFEDK